MLNDIEKINLQAGMIDSHFHLFHMKNREMPYMQIIQECFAKGLELALDIGINPDNFSERIKTAADLSGLYTAHGYYPSMCTADKIDALLLNLEETLKRDSKAVGLGEIGFDFFHDYGSYEQQKKLFITQLELAEKLSLPVIIHSRNAEKETLELLKKHSPSRGGIIHCFSYSPETALEFIDMGFYISFAGNLTYKKAEIIQAAAAAVPVDRLLLETDAPYLSPQKVRSRKNHPGYIGYTYNFAAELKGLSLDELISAVNQNFRTLFRIR